MTFDSAAVDTLFDKVQSHAMQLNLFEGVNTHEPKSAPGNGLRCAIWVQAIRPITSSGLASTSGAVDLMVRIYGNMLQTPYDSIDPNILKAVTTLLNAYTGDFDFGVTVRDIDLLGQHGTAMSARAGYVRIDNHLYRVMDITLPVIINDMWTQAG